MAALRVLGTVLTHRLSFLVIACVFCASGSGAPAAAEHSGRDQELYILPVLSAGPNNQLIQLKVALTLAHLLGRTVLLTGIFEHYKDFQQHRRRSKQRVLYSLEALFDRAALNVTVRTISVPALKRRGWSGRVDAVLALRDEKNTGELNSNRLEYVAMLERALGVEVLVSELPQVEWNADSLCSKRGVKRLRKAVKSYRVIAVYPAKNMPGNSRWPTPFHRDSQELMLRPLQGGDDDPASSGRCREGFLAVNNGLQIAQPLRQLADSFIAEELGGHGFAAAHVRPYPDSCMQVWTLPGAPTPQQLTACKNPALLRRLAGDAAEAMRRQGLRHLFVMAPPGIRWRVNRMLVEVNVTAHYLGPDAPAMKLLPSALMADDKRATYTVLMFAEQAIAVRAAAFIGTSHSSATWTIVHQRAAARAVAGASGIEAQDSFFTNEL